jgi:hypothetical protein
MKISSIFLFLSILAVSACKEDKRIIQIEEDKNLVGNMAGNYNHVSQSFDMETEIRWSVYRLSDSTVSLKSVVKVIHYPGNPIIRTDSIALIKLTKANTISFTKQNTDSFSELNPGGYLLSGTGKLAGNELEVNLKFVYKDCCESVETGKLLRW